MTQNGPIKTRAAKPAARELKARADTPATKPAPSPQSSRKTGALARVAPPSTPTAASARPAHAVAKSDARVPPSARVEATSSPHPAILVAAPIPGVPGQSKQARVVAMLGQGEGATITELMATTGWLSHSVRGFLTSVVRQKLGLDLTSEVVDGERTYRVVTPKPAKTRSAGRKPGPTSSALA